MHVFSNHQPRREIRTEPAEKQTSTCAQKRHGVWHKQLEFDNLHWWWMAGRITDACSVDASTYALRPSCALETHVVWLAEHNSMLQTSKNYTRTVFAFTHLSESLGTSLKIVNWRLDKKLDVVILARNWYSLNQRIKVCLACAILRGADEVSEWEYFRILIIELGHQSS